MIDFDTLPNAKDPKALIESIDHVRRQHDSTYLLDLMKKITGKEAVVWGDEAIGFGRYQYVYKTGRTGKWPIISFTPSLQNITIHVMPGIEVYLPLIEKIGNVKHTPNALILHKFSDLNRPALERFVQRVILDIEKKYDCA